MTTQAQTVDEYIAELQEKLSLNPECASHHYNLGLAYLSKRMWPEAEACFRATVEHSPRFAEAYVQLGGICLQRGDLEGCLSFNRHAKDCRLQYAVPWANMGFCYIQLGKYDEAVKCLKKAINRDPDFVQAHATLGSAHIMAKNYDDGITASRKALDLVPEFGPAWNNLAVAYMDTGETAMAVECADKAEQFGYELAPEFKKEIEEARKSLA